jgi:prevent-host-death family protein
VKRVSLVEAKATLPALLRRAGRDGVVITRQGKPAGVLIGFATESDWHDYRLENDPRFLGRVRRSRASVAAGRVRALEDLDVAARRAGRR